MSLEQVIWEKREVDHEDERRQLLAVFNGDITLPSGELFRPLQVKLLLTHQNCQLGGHYHQYAELFYMLNGECTFTLEDINTKERKKYILSEKTRLFVPAYIAHRVDTILKSSILIGLTENQYQSPQVNDIKYEFK